MKKLLTLITLFIFLSAFTFPKIKDLVHVNDVEWTKQSISSFLGAKNEWSVTNEEDTTWYNLQQISSGPESVTLVIRNNKVSIVNFSNFNQEKTTSIMENFGIGVVGPIKKVFNRNQRDTMILTDRYLFYLTDTFGQTQMYTTSFQYDPEHVNKVIKTEN